LGPKSADGKAFIVSKNALRASSVTPEFVRVLNEVNKRYGAALSMLAKL